MADPKRVTARDYYRIGFVYVRKWLAYTLLIVGALAVLAVFGLPDGLFGPRLREPPAYRWDDPALQGLSGQVRLLDSAGRMRYRGEITAGACTGRGTVFGEDGSVVYEGPLVNGVYEGENGVLYEAGEKLYEGGFSGGLYEGQGRRYRSPNGLVGVGAFSAGQLNGEGREETPDGTLVREGVFARDLLEGEGREYRADGQLLREGSFSGGLLHGEGTAYAADGSTRYEGMFRRGVYHGQGLLYTGGVPAYEGGFRDGCATGSGRLFHPSGQVLYTGPVCDARPRADAFLGLSLAEVEAAFAGHWLLYACDGTTGFVYPDYGLVFATESPVPLVSPAARQAEAAASLPEPAGAGDPETASDAAPLPRDGGKELPPAAPADEMLSPDAVHADIIICEVLSCAVPLPGTPQPDGSPADMHLTGWREWFSAYLRGEALPGASARTAGPFVTRFTPKEGVPAAPVREALAEGGGILTKTVYFDGKEQPLWYQSAIRTPARLS